MKYKDFGKYVASFNKFPDRLAMTTRPYLKIERLTYKQLQTRAYQTARYLLDNGVVKGDRVMVAAINSPQWIELMLGCQLIGAILVSVDVTNSTTIILRYQKQTTPKLIFKNSSLHTEMDKLSGVISLDDLDSYIDKYPATSPIIKLQGGLSAVIVFTSGTTADPKGVVLTQENILTNIVGIQDRIDVDPNWRVLSVLPLSHMYELTGVLTLMSRGVSIFNISHVTPANIAKAMVDYQITMILGIPQLLSLVLEQINQTAREEGKTNLLAVASKAAAVIPFSLRRYLFHSVHSRLGGHLRIVVTGGAPIPIDVARAWENMGVKTVQGYGLTETSPLISVNSLDERQLDSPGRPIDNVQVRIAGSGEIQVKGDSVFRGYWQNDAATKESFTKNGWFKTGDVGRIKNGWLYIRGRIKFIIVRSSGLKVFPEDIESVAEGNKAFSDLCIVGLVGEQGESVLAVITSDKSDRTIEKAISTINGTLESFQHIDEWRRWRDKDFPRTRLGKVDRKQVENWANNTVILMPSKEPDVAVKEDQLTQIIRLISGHPKLQIRASDHLADLGLDSLRRLTLVSLIETRLGITIAEENINQETTIATLRKLLNKGSHVEAIDKRPKWTYYKWVRLIGNAVREVVIRGLLRIWVKLRVEGRNNLDNLDTPAIFIFNHTDDFDAPVIYNSLPHYIRKRLAVASASDVLDDHKFLAFIDRLFYAGFNLNRFEPYMPSLMYTSELIDKGWNIVLSPEGRLSPSGRLLPFKLGVGLLAVNLGVPVVPLKTIGLTGTVPLHSKWPKKRSKVTVRIGKPIVFDAKSDYTHATIELQHIMQDL